MTTTKLQLPKGKITIRHRQMRNVFQCFAGNNYILGASGDYAEDAAQELANQYDVPEGSVATVHGYKHPATIIIPASCNWKTIEIARDAKLLIWLSIADTNAS